MLPVVVAENVLKGKLKLEGATLDVRPKSITSSHRQSTQLKNTSEKWHQLKTADRDSDQLLNQQLGILSGQDVKAGCQDWDVGAERCDSHPIEETSVECTESTECDIGESQERNRGVFPAEFADFEGRYSICSLSFRFNCQHCHVVAMLYNIQKMGSDKLMNAFCFQKVVRTK